MRAKIGLFAAVSLGGLAVWGCAPTGSAVSSPTLAQGAAGCEAVSANALGASNAAGKWIAADAAKGLPAYCEVTATLSPVAGSAIGVVYRLPEGWNGKVLGLGGGGWAGNVTLDAATPGLTARYATAQTDGGHASTAPFENQWVSNPIQAEDFAYRAIHEMTKAGKKLVASYYGRKQDRAYFHGCSTGGRMALMEAQRFPDDYDAIIAMAPVYTLQTQSSAVLRNNSFAAPGAALGTEGAAAASKAALAACDAKDGVTDGVIADPRSCRFDPASTPGLSVPQVAALRTAYDGVRGPDGSWVQLPLSRGGEAGWGAFVAINGDRKEFSNGGGTGGLLPVLFPGKTVDLNAFTPAEVVEARRSAFAAMYEAKDPNLSPFFAKGGRLLLWHGESDPGPSPVATIEYAEAVKSASPRAAQSMRLFLAPGVGHCAGGPGPDQIDPVTVLDRWVDSGNAPEQITARKADGSVVRPLCAWPKVARFDGSGDVNDPSNYSCVARD